MVSSDFRKEAREKLSGKWGKAACIALAYSFIIIVLNIIQSILPDSVQSLVSLAITIINVPLSLGLIISLVKLFNEEEVNSFDFLTSGFNNFAKSWGITFQICLKLILPIILMVIAIVLILAGGITQSAMGILSDSSSSGSAFFIIIGMILFIAASIWNVTKSYYYQLAYIIAAEKPELSAEEAVEESEKVMRGNRGKLFCLQLSFIGWAILCAFTFGIGYLWLMPYMQFAIIAFYEFVNDNNSSIETTVENED